MFYYADLNENNICHSIMEAYEKSANPLLIEIPAYDKSYCGKKYNNGTWEDTPKPEPKPVTLSEQQQAVLDTAINTDYLVCLADLGL